MCEVWLWFWATWKNCEYQWWAVASSMLCVSIEYNTSIYWISNSSCWLCYPIVAPNAFVHFPKEFFMNSRVANIVSMIFRCYLLPVAVAAVRSYSNCPIWFEIFRFILSNVSGEFIIGRVIKAMNANWHPKCFLCEMCDKELADQGFIRHQNKALCHDCNARAKAASLGKHVCHKCQ